MKQYVNLRGVPPRFGPLPHWLRPFPVFSSPLPETTPGGSKCYAFGFAQKQIESEFHFQIPNLRA